MTSSDSTSDSVRSTGAEDAAAATTGASVARGGLWEIAGLVLPQFYVFIVSAVTAHLLGPSLFGRIALITGVQAAVTTLLMWGVPYGLIRYAGELLGAGRGGELRPLMLWAFRVSGALSVVAFVVMMGAASTGARPVDAWLLAAFTAAGAVLQSVPSAFLVGAQRWRDARIMGMTTGALSSVLKVIALSTGHGIVSLFAIDLVIVVLNLAGTLYLAVRSQRRYEPAILGPRLTHDVLQFAGIAGITAALNLVVYQRTEIFVLAHYRGDAEIAKYTVPFSLVSTLLLFPGAVSSVISPAVATLWGAGDVARIRSGFARGVRLMTLLTFTLAGVSAATGTIFIHLAFGARFAHVQGILIVLLVSLPLVPLGTMSAAVLRAIGALKWLTLLGVVAAAADIAISFALIAPFGAIGAAYANTVAQLIASLPLLVYLSNRLGGIGFDWWNATRVAITSTVAAVAAYVVAHAVPVGVGLVLAPVVFAVIAVGLGATLRILSPDDRTWMATVVRATVLGRLLPRRRVPAAN